jgi:hypothetical protein
MSGDFCLREKAIGVGGLAVFESEMKEFASALGVKRQALRRYPKASLSEIWRRVGGPPLPVARTLDAIVAASLMPRHFRFAEPPVRGVWLNRKTGQPYGIRFTGSLSGGPRVTTMRLASALVDSADRDAMFATHVVLDADSNASMGWLWDLMSPHQVVGGYGHMGRVPPYSECRCSECADAWPIRECSRFLETPWIYFVHSARAFLDEWELVSWLPRQEVYEIDRRPVLMAEILCGDRDTENPRRNVDLPAVDLPRCIPANRVVRLDDPDHPYRRVKRAAGL